MRTTPEGVLWPPFFKIRLGQYLYLIPTTDKSLAKSYFFNLACSICLYHKATYLKSWLQYYILRHNARPRLEQRYLQYEKHVAEKEPMSNMFKVSYNEAPKPFYNGANPMPILTSGELQKGKVKIEGMGPLGPFRLIGEYISNVELTNLTPNDQWETIADGDILLLIRHKVKDIYALIDKTTGKRITFKDKRKVKRVKADFRRIYSSWHLDGVSR